MKYETETQNSASTSDNEYLVGFSGTKYFQISRFEQFLLIFSVLSKITDVLLLLCR